MMRAIAPTPMEAAYLRVFDPVAVGDLMCGRCGRYSKDQVPAAEVISQKYTGFDDWIRPEGPLCPVCAWGLSSSGMRSTTMAIRTDGVVDELSRDDLADVLAAPITDVAVVIPLRPGRKHLLPFAAWSQVTVDDATVRWGPAEVEFRDAMAWLRGSGLSVAMIAGTAPDIGVMRALPTRELSLLLDALSFVRGWRGSPHWEIAVRATTAVSTRRQ